MPLSEAQSKSLCSQALFNIIGNWYGNHIYYKTHVLNVFIDLKGLIRVISVAQY